MLIKKIIEKYKGTLEKENVIILEWDNDFIENIEKDFPEFQGNDIFYKIIEEPSSHYWGFEFSSVDGEYSICYGKVRHKDNIYYYVIDFGFGDGLKIYRKGEKFNPVREGGRESIVINGSYLYDAPFMKPDEV